MIVLAGLLTGVAVWLMVPPRAHRRIAKVTNGDRARVSPLPWWRQRVRLGFGPAGRRRAARERARTVQALGALAAELDAGRTPAAALLAAGGSPSVWPTAASAAQIGEDVVSALLHDSASRPQLRMLAACWQVSSETGTGFAASVTRLAVAARAQEAVRVDLEGELAAPRATARILAVLPLIGLGFGAMLGANPLTWLFTTVPGLGCLVVGLMLTGLGALWTGRIATSVERLL